MAGSNNDEANRRMTEQLAGMFPELSRSVIAAVVPDASGDIERAALTLRDFHRDPVQEERARLAALSDAQKLGMMRDALGSAFAEEQLRAALRAAAGDVTAAINRLFSTSALPMPPQPQQPKPQQPKPLDDMRVEERVRREQEEALRRAQASKRPQPPQQQQQSPQQQLVTASTIVRVETAAKQREQSLEKHISDLSRQLAEAEARLARAHTELGSAERQRAEEVSRAREEAEVRELRANLEKDQIAKRLEETRTQLAHLLAEQEREAAAAAAASAAAAAAAAATATQPPGDTEGSSSSSASSTAYASAVSSQHSGSEIRCMLQARAVSADTIEFRWDAAGLPLGSGDWVGLFIHNRQFSNKYSAYHRTKGQASGEGRFRGLCPGTYDLRFFLGGTPRETAKTEPVLLGVGVDLDVGFEHKGRNREIRVSWDGQAAGSTGNDWVGLYRAETRSNKQYIACQYVAAFTSLVFAAPREPGRYSVRYFRASSGYCFSGSTTVEVPNEDKLEVVAAPGGTVRVSWACFSAEPARGDWIGVFESSAPDARRLGFAYTSAGRSPEGGDHGAIDIQVPASAKGDQAWEIRFFATALPKDRQVVLRVPFVPETK